MYRPEQRPKPRTRLCPHCRKATCEVAITAKNEKEILLDVLPPGETHDEGRIVIQDTPRGPRAFQYGEGKVPPGAIRRVAHISVCVAKAKTPDRWAKIPDRPDAT